MNRKEGYDWPARGDVLEVTWKDHMGRSRWDDPDKHKTLELGVCRSVGYLLHEDAERLVLVMSQCEASGHVDDSCVIGKKLVVSRKVLRKGTK